MPEASIAEQAWPGQRLGMPRSGPGSIARLGRRLAALAIDFVPVVLISVAFFDYDRFATLAIYAVIQIVFVLIVNASPGHLVMGLRVVRLAGGYVGAWRPFVRAILICLVIPAVIWDADQRGLHDRLIGTALIRR